MSVRFADAVRCGTPALLVLTALLAGCGPPPFTFTISFPGEATLESGAVVRYQGVDVGHVKAVELRQADPERPAQVEVVCAITNPEITVRRDDLFEIASDGLLGEDYLRITPIPVPSPALAPGSTVAGTPPIVTRVRESAEETLESLSSFAREKAGAWLDALSDESPEAPPNVPPPPTP